MNICKTPDCTNYVENEDIGLCSSCARLERKKKSTEVKQAKKKKRPWKKKNEISEYSKKKKLFFSIPQNQICRVCGLPAADSIHHGAGRVGYWDDESRDAGISLLMDERFWIPIHSFNVNPSLGTSCHQWVESNPMESKKLGLSFDRLIINR